MPQYVYVLDTGRIGDWRIVDAPTEELARKQLTRTARRKILYVREHVPTSRRLYEANLAGREWPEFVPRRRRRR